MSNNVSGEMTAGPAENVYSGPSSSRHLQSLVSGEADVVSICIPK